MQMNMPFMNQQQQTNRPQQPMMKNQQQIGGAQPMLAIGNGNQNPAMAKYESDMKELERLRNQEKKKQDHIGAIVESATASVTTEKTQGKSMEVMNMSRIVTREEFEMNKEETALATKWIMEKRDAEEPDYDIVNTMMRHIGTPVPKFVPVSKRIVVINTRIDGHVVRGLIDSGSSITKRDQWTSTLEEWITWERTYRLTSLLEEIQ
jgi:hypothetical protein